MIIMISVILCIELPQVQYIDVSEVVHVVKNDIIVTMKCTPKVINLFCGPSPFKW